LVDSQGAEDALLDRIAERRAELVGQAERLRKELAEVEAELARVVTAEQVVAQLLTQAESQAVREAGQEGDPAPDVVVPDPPHVPLAGGRAVQGLAVPHRTDGVTAQDLPDDYRRLMQIVAEEGPVACKRVCAKLGLTGEPRHTEGVRVKLKRLVERGWLIETAPGRFSPRS
jgi:hypothetical protein